MFSDEPVMGSPLFSAVSVVEHMAYIEEVEYLALVLISNL